MILRGIKRLVQTAILSLLLVAPVSAAELRVPAGGDLQTALNVAQPGDVVCIPAGSTFMGNYRLPSKLENVTLTTCGSLPERRVTPADKPLLGTIGSPIGFMALEVGSNWTIDGLHLLPNAGGFGEVISVQGESKITFKRLLLDIPEPQQLKRFILGNGTYITFTQSYCSGVWRSGQDSQCFAAWDGAGPFTISDNFLEAASENVLFGGADATSEANIPSDILVEHNTFSKRLIWKGTARQVKNLFELKNAKRVVIRQNIFENNWADAQSGWAILFTPRNQDGTNPYTIVKDVLFEDNIVRNTPMGLNIYGYDDLNPSQQTTDIVVRRNTITVTNKGFLVHGHVGNLAIYENTINGPDGSVLMSLDKEGVSYAADFLLFANNTAPGMWIHSPTASGEQAFKEYVKVYSLTMVTIPPPTEEPPPVVTPLPNPEIEALKARVAVLETRLDAALNYLANLPSAKSIMQLINSLRLIPR